MRKSQLLGTMTLVFLLALAGSAAHAGGFYVGGSLGQTSSDLSGDVGSMPDVTVNDTDTGYKVFGGFNFIKFFAVEAAWVDVAEVSAETANQSLTADANGFSFEAMGILPLGAGFELFADYGVYVWDGTAKFASVGLPTTEQGNDGTDPTFGLGLGWDFKGPGQVRAEVERYQVSNMDVDMYSVGFSFGF